VRLRPASVICVRCSVLVTPAASVAYLGRFNSLLLLSYAALTNPPTPVFVAPLTLSCAFCGGMPWNCWPATTLGAAGSKANGLLIGYAMLTPYEACNAT